MRLNFICVVLFITGIIQAQDVTTITKFRVDAYGGYSYRLATLSNGIPESLKSHVQGLKSGANFGIDAQYFFSNYGVGIAYSVFTASSETPNMQVTSLDGQFQAVGTIKSRDNIIFLGPSFSGRSISKNEKHVFVGTFAIGLLQYKTINNFIISRIESKGSTVGFSSNFAYDYKVAKNFYIGARLNYTGGALSKVKVNDGSTTTIRELDNDQKENLGRLDISAGIKFHF